MIHAASLALLLASPPSDPPAFERSIDSGRGGRVAVRLDRDVYESAREDLGDLRVLDESGRLAPFLVDRGETVAPRSEVRAELRNAAWRPDGSLSAVLDFGGRVRKARLRLSLSGDNFRRRVRVEASDDGKAWSSLLDEAWVFAVPGDGAGARYETVTLPANDFPLLRVTVHPGDAERERVRISGAAVPASGEEPRREELLRPRFSRAEDGRARETWLVVELGARHQPFHAVELEVADARFFREVLVEARRESRAGAPAGVSWLEIGRGAIYRLEHGGRAGECLRLDVSGRERAIRVRLRNADDRPLDVRAVVLRVPAERVVFVAEPRRAYRLVYGSDAASPAFDLERTVGDAASWAAGAVDVPLAAPRRLARPAAEPLPWTERNRGLVWGGLVAVVAVLGALTWRALREAGR